MHVVQSEGDGRPDAVVRGRAFLGADRKVWDRAHSTATHTTCMHACPRPAPLPLCLYLKVGSISCLRVIYAECASIYSGPRK